VSSCLFLVTRMVLRDNRKTTQIVLIRYWYGTGKKPTFQLKDIRSRSYESSLSTGLKTNNIARNMDNKQSSCSHDTGISTS
jgi:hypothetical protein